MCLPAEFGIIVRAHTSIGFGVGCCYCCFCCCVWQQMKTTKLNKRNNLKHVCLLFTRTDAILTFLNEAIFQLLNLNEHFWSMLYTEALQIVKRRAQLWNHRTDGTALPCLQNWTVRNWRARSMRRKPRITNAFDNDITSIKLLFHPDSNYW